MILSFRSKALRRLFEHDDPSKLNVPNVGRVQRILERLALVSEPSDMNQPGYRFHALKGTAKGRHAVDASGNWRITFGWSGEDAVGVDLEDYH